MPAAAAATFAVVPAGVPLKIATSYVASILGTAGRRRLVPGRDEAALIELAALLDGDFSSVTTEQIAAVGDKYGVPGDEFEAMRVDLFAKFVLAMLKNPEFKPAELRPARTILNVFFHSTTPTAPCVRVHQRSGKATGGRVGLGIGEITRDRKGRSKLI